ncbi:MAG: hypothetical protein CVV24_12355, partial [Ignavibacteriae bacterium HGW-Ignavibacteriae-3]
MVKKILLFALCVYYNASAQSSFIDYAPFYPIGEDSNIRLMTSYTKQESILFEANPMVRFSVYNNFVHGLMNNYSHAQAWYISIRSQIRMYSENSLPIKTPSYRAFLGTQHLFRLFPDNPSYKIEHFLGFSLESGHYSNGQTGCAFSADYDDKTAGCDSIYSLINPSTNLSEMLNRRNGNFSTNLTELVINYRKYFLDVNNIPQVMHSLSLGLVLYHDKIFGIGNIGGYSANDIKIYGRYRYSLGYEYLRVLGDGAMGRFSFKQNIELIKGAHKFVNPVRCESTFTYYPFISSESLGFFISYVFG